MKKKQPVVVHVANLNRKKKYASKADRKADTTCKFTSGGHYIVLTGYDTATGIYTVNDPGRNRPPNERKQATKAYLEDNCHAAGFLLVTP